MKGKGWILMIVYGSVFLLGVDLKMTFSFPFGQKSDFCSNPVTNLLLKD